MSSRRGVEVFERRVVLRVSRGLYLTLASIAALALVGSVAVLAYALSPTITGPRPAEPVPPQPPEVTLAEVGRALTPPAPAQAAAASIAAAEERPAPSDPGSQRLDLAVDRLKALFQTDRYPFIAEVRRTCASRFGRRCTYWQQKLVRKGVTNLVNEALSGTSSADARAQKVEAFAAAAAALDARDLDRRDLARFAAVSASAELMQAMRDPSSPVQAALQRTLTAAGGTSKEMTDERLQLVNDVAAAVHRARKRGASPAAVEAWVAAMPDLWPLFTVGADGESNRVEGLVAAFDATRDAPDGAVVARLAAVKAMASQAPGALRPQYVRAFGELVRERGGQALRDYQRAMAEYRREVEATESAAEATRTAKRAMIYPAASGLGSAIAGLAVLGLFLALLAIERNTRVLEEALRELPVAPAGAAPRLVAGSPASADPVVSIVPPA